MTKSVVITGGGGFIGSHAVDLFLSKGFDVRVIDNFSGGRWANLEQHAKEPRLTVIEKDIRDVNAEDAVFSGVDRVVHFAGIGDIVPSIERPIEYMDVNVLGTCKILEAARYAGVKKFVYAASSSCYGIAETPTHEGHAIDPKYPYALSKYQGEQAAFHWARVYGVPVNSIRIFNAYGTRSRTSGAYGAVFGVFLKQKLAGQPFTVVGDGTQSRDFVYVTDVANAFYLAATTELTGCVWNLGAGNPQSVNYLVELLGGEVTYIPKRPGEPDVTHADIVRIQNDLGWKQNVSFEEGVQRILDNIEYWAEAPLWTPETIKRASTTWFKHMGQG